MRIQLTVYFEDPFWVGLFEPRDGENLSVCRVVLGTSEPRDWEVHRWVLEGAPVGARGAQEGAPGGDA